MQKYIYLILTFLYLGCLHNQEKNSRFTEEQIASLNLKSSKIVNVETDSIVTLDLNPFLKRQTFDFASLVKHVKLIPLETTNESLLDKTHKILVTDSHIYIHDDFKDGGIVIFDNEGKFVRRIPYGKGPGELMRLYDIAFDEKNDELIAFQHSYLLFFTPSGQYIRQKKLPFMFHEFTVIPEGYIFKSIDRQRNTHLGQLQDFTLLITNKKFKINYFGLKNLPRDMIMEGRDYLYKKASSTYITQRFKDTIYEYVIKENQLKAKYFLNYNSKKLPDRYLEGNLEDFENAVRDNDYYFYLGEYRSTQTHDVFFLNNWYHDLQVVVYRDKNAGKLKGGTEAIYNPDELPPIAFPRGTSNNNFISWYYPGEDDLFATNSTIISEADKQKVKGLTRNDNPVLVFYKLKEF